MMTVSEAIEHANNGNTEAMFQLGRYYWSEEKDYQEAQKWYLMGAKAGDPRCMDLAASNGVILANVTRKLGGDFVADCVRDLEVCLFWAEKARANGLECDSTEIENELGICSYLAFVHERDKMEYLYKAEEALKANHPAKDAETRMYLAFTLRDKGGLQKGLNDEDAFLLFNLLKDCALNHRTELYHGDIVCYYLGEAYLEGQGCQRDDNLAYQWMSTAQEMGFNCREILSRFKKKLFGGYVFQW